MIKKSNYNYNNNLKTCNFITITSVLNRKILVKLLRVDLIEQQQKQKRTRLGNTFMLMSSMN